MAATVYLASVLLEPQRWKRGHPASIALSRHAAAAAAAGFDGWELFANHWLEAPPAERAALRAGPLPVAVFNGYADFGPEGAEARAAEAAAAVALGAAGLKFNFGSDVTLLDDYRRALDALLAALPQGCRALCECHPNTLLESPDAAWAVAADYPPERLGLIVHPFAADGALDLWFDVCGPRIVHAHVQTRAPDRRFARLDARPTHTAAVLERLHGLGFAGTFSVEFTEGVQTAGETPELLLANAAADLAFLREYWPD